MNLVDMPSAKEVGQPSPTEVAIDRAVLDDLPMVIQIDGEITGQPKPEFWYSFYTTHRSDQNNPFLVARHDGQVVGYIIGSVRAWEFGSPTCGWIRGIGVRPEFRKLGVATSLFDNLVSIFRSLGLTTIRTMIRIDDQLLMSFFRFQGMAAGPFIELEMSAEDETPAERPE
jgi:GNAT superfamily N-acetyltransferase